MKDSDDANLKESVLFHIRKHSVIMINTSPEEFIVPTDEIGYFFSTKLLNRSKKG